jgi:threonyl-tRNA synthetase
VHRHGRQRRDHLIAVLGEAEAAAGTVRVTDVAAGLEREVGEALLIRLAGDAYAARRPHVDWPGEITAV